MADQITPQSEPAGAADASKDKEKPSLRQRGNDLVEQMQPIATAALVGGLSAAAVATAAFLISRRRSRKRSES